MPQSKSMPLTPGKSRGAEQGKAIKAPQSKSHNKSVQDPGAAGKQPKVSK